MFLASLPGSIGGAKERGKTRTAGEFVFPLETLRTPPDVERRSNDSPDYVNGRSRNGLRVDQATTRAV